MASNIFVKLVSSKNTYITYPAHGLLEILEFGSTGSIIVARFRQETDGKLGAAVEVRDAVFEYSPEIASKGRAAVVEFHQRQIDGDKSRNYQYQLIDSDSDRVMGRFASRMFCDLFCTKFGVRVRENHVFAETESVKSYAYFSFGTNALADMFAEISLAKSSGQNEGEFIKRLESIGFQKNQASDAGIFCWSTMTFP